MFDTTPEDAGSGVDGACAIDDAGSYLVWETQMTWLMHERVKSST